MLNNNMVMVSFHDGIEKNAVAAAVATGLLRGAGVIGRRLLGRFGRRAIGIAVKPRTGMKGLLFGKGMTIGQRASGVGKGLIDTAATTGLIGAGGIGYGALTQHRQLPPGMLR